MFDIWDCQCDFFCTKNWFEGEKIRIRSHLNYCVQLSLSFVRGFVSHSYNNTGFYNHSEKTHKEVCNKLSIHIQKATIGEHYQTICLGDETKIEKSTIDDNDPKHRPNVHGILWRNENQGMPQCARSMQEQIHQKHMTYQCNDHSHKCQDVPFVLH
jgi:hypothetical protein